MPGGRRRAGSDTKGFSTGRLSVFDPDNVWEGTPQSHNGNIDPRWFYDATFKQRRYMQLDFMFKARHLL